MIRMAKSDSRPLATAILTGQRGAEQFVDVDGALEPRKSSVNVKGSGMPGSEVPALSPAAPITEDGVTSIDAGELTLLVNRVLDPETPGSDDSAGLRGTWAGQEAPVLLATLSQA